MRFFPTIAAVTLLGMLCIAQTAHAQAAEPLKDVDALKQMFADQKYPDVLKEISRILVRKGDAIKSYDLYEVYSLKGETHLRLKGWSLAAEAFANAEKNTTDDQKAMTARATQYLIKHSTNGQYHAKNTPTSMPAGATATGSKGALIDIIDPDSRKMAINALMNDELAGVTSRVKALKGQNGLRPLAQAITIVRDFRSLELAATGADTQSKAMLDDLTANSSKMMTDAITQMSTQVEAISRSANTQIMSSDQMTRTMRLAGLTGRDRQDLQEVINTCAQLIPAAHDMAAALGTSGTEFTQIQTQAETVGNRANEVLNKNYERQYR